MKNLKRWLHHGRSRQPLFIFIILLNCLLIITAVVTAESRTPLNVAGYLSFSYGTTVKEEPTAEKPESKLWWNDDIWWGSLYNSEAGEYRIYRLDWGTQNWLDTGVPLDDREESRADVLWDEAGGKLYVASHIKLSNPSQNSNSDEWARLYRYTYDTAVQTYLLDSGFPVTINQDKTETLVLDKDSTGRLWITYVSRISGAEEYQVYVNASDGNDLIWGTPFALPFSQAFVDMDDIAALIAFTDLNGPKVGVFWSNQLNDEFHFASHSDSLDPQNGWILERRLGIGYPSDDHIHLAKTADGRVLAAVKTEATQDDEPLIGVIGRDNDGTFSFHSISPVSSLDTRPILVVDDIHHQVYIFMTSKSGGGDICYQAATITSPLANMSFPFQNCETLHAPGVSPFIADTTYVNVDNATSTKQNIDINKGIVVLASDDLNGKVYVHNILGGSDLLPEKAFLPLVMR